MTTTISAADQCAYEQRERALRTLSRASNCDASCTLAESPRTTDLRQSVSVVSGIADVAIKPALAILLAELLLPGFVANAASAAWSVAAIPTLAASATARFRCCF